MKDRVSANGRTGYVKLTSISGETDTYKLERADNPTQEGTSLNKALFDYALAAIGTTAGTSTAYTLAGDGGFSLTDGAKINFKLHVDSGATPTINVNGTGAKALNYANGKSMKAGIQAGTWLTATYSTTLGFFVLQGSTGAEGGKLIGNDVGQISFDEIKDAARYDLTNYTKGV